MLRRLRRLFKKAGKYTAVSPKVTPAPEVAAKLLEAQSKYANTGWLVQDHNRPWFKP